MADAVVTLPGDPPQWPATVRELLRAATEGGLDRPAALEALADQQPPDAGPAERRLAFLEAADVVTCEEGACRPGASGREYLQTHDESVLFAALADAVDGFEGLVEALAVRPLTDVEAADLLSAERDGDADTAVADRYLAWLRALGYISREDGVNDLTRTGRRLVATTDRLTPPGGDASPPAGSQPDDSPDAIRTCEGMVPDASADVEEWSIEDSDGTDDGSTKRDSGSATSDGRSTTHAGSGPPSTTDSGADDSEVVVDADLEREMRARYDDTCMLCGDRRQSGTDAGYAEVHFLMPRRDPHDGPASAANALVVCPNHRADLEHGAVTIDPQSLTVAHGYESAVDGRTLRTVEGHDVGAQYLAYHNDVVAGN